MSSSFKQKKMKTLVTRKKTRKRHMESGMTHEDDSDRLFQPPSKRDPRWKKPSAAELVSNFVSSKKAKLNAAARASNDDDEEEDDDDDGFELAPAVHSDVDDDDKDASESSDEDQDVHSAEPSHTVSELKHPLRICSSLDDCLDQVKARHLEIRRVDGRQKTKVLLMVDIRSLYKAMKTKLNIKAEPIKSKSKLGIRSMKKAEMAYKNIGAVKTPMDKFKDSNKAVLTDYKVGKINTILTEDLSYYPYSELAPQPQHVIYVAKSAQSVINLDQTLLADMMVHVYIVDGATVSQEDSAKLKQAFSIVEQ